MTEGNVGAGAGATVGKSGGRPADEGGHRIRGDPSAQRPASSAALVAVNAVGDIIDPATGQVIAGARTEDGKHLGDARTLAPARGPGATAGRARTRRSASSPPTRS